jgi:hypothetical protein
MSTRAIYTFIDQDAKPKDFINIYKHYDGYPSGALEAIQEAFAYAWTLPRFEADDFAAAFVAGNKSVSGGGIRVFPTGPQKNICKSACDIEYRYEVRCIDNKLHITAFETSYWQTPKETGLFAGNIEEFREFCKEEETT